MRATALFVVVLSLFTAAEGQFRAYVSALPAAPFYTLGDTLKINLNVATGTSQITGFALYATFDPDVFKPILADPAKNKPFTNGNFFSPIIHNPSYEGAPWTIQDAKSPPVSTSTDWSWTTRYSPPRK